MLLLKNLTIVEVVMSQFAPQRALDLLVVNLTTRNPWDYIKNQVEKRESNPPPQKVS